jgi:hypothetical protein
VRALSGTPKAPAYIWDVEVEFVDKEPRLEGGMRLRRVAMGKMWAEMELHLAWSYEVWMDAAAEEKGVGEEIRGGGFKKEKGEGEEIRGGGVKEKKRERERSKKRKGTRWIKKLS